MKCKLFFQPGVLYTCIFLNTMYEKYSAVHSRTVELPDVDKSIIMEATKYILH